MNILLNMDMIDMSYFSIDFYLLMPTGADTSFKFGPTVKMSDLIKDIIVL